MREFLNPIQEFTEDDSKKLKVEKNLELQGGKKIMNKFEEALQNGKLEDAEELLKQAGVSEHYKNYPRLIDHAERNLFAAYRDRLDKEGMIRVIRMTKNPQSKAGRIKNYEYVIKQPYPHEEGEKEELKSALNLKEKNQEARESIKIFNTKSFQEALKTEEGIEQAEEWLNNQAEQSYKEKGLSGSEIDRILRHRKSELNEAKRKFEMEVK